MHTDTETVYGVLENNQTHQTVHVEPLVSFPQRRTVLDASYLEIFWHHNQIYQGWARSHLGMILINDDE